MERSKLNISSYAFAAEFCPFRWLVSTDWILLCVGFGIFSRGSHSLDLTVWIFAVWIFQNGGGVPQQGSSPGCDVDGPQDEGRASALRAAALGTRRKIVRLLSYVRTVLSHKTDGRRYRPIG